VRERFGDLVIVKSLSAGVREGFGDLVILKSLSAMSEGGIW
jgi:hypothetical protein